VTAYKLQQIQPLAHRNRHGLAPWSATGNRSAEPTFQFGYEACRSQRAPECPPRSLKDVNFSSQSSNNKSRKVGQRSSTGRTGTRLSSSPASCARTLDHAHSSARDTSRRPSRIQTDVRHRRPQVRLVHGDQSFVADGECVGEKVVKLGVRNREIQVKGSASLGNRRPPKNLVVRRDWYFGKTELAKDRM
jgi:hypothetical protein